MTAADDAFAAAERLIAEAKRTGAEGLSFDTEETHALTRLPESIVGLDKLTRLGLDNTQISDLALLSGLRALQVLSLTNTPVNDITALNTHYGLQILTLDGTQITELTLLGNQDMLRELSLNNTRVTDLSQIASLRRLERLSFSNTQVSDLTPLAGLKNLLVLSLAITPVRDLSPLVGQLNLQSLRLNGTRVIELSPLAELKGLWELQLDGTPVSDLTPLAGLTGLRTLKLGVTRITDLTPLAGLTELVQLWFENTQVGDLTPLARLGRLKSLVAENTPIFDLSPLAGLKEVQVLHLNGTLVTELTPLAGLTGMRTLGLDGTKISNLAPLAGLTRLKTLGLGSTLIADLTPLSGLTGLEELWFDKTPVSDLTPLAGMKEMRTLQVDGTQVRDLRTLVRLRKLLEPGKFVGLSFSGIPATRDPLIAEIAAMDDPKERAAALFALLEAGWEPPGEVEAEALKQDPLLRSILIDGQLEIDRNPPTEEERRDRVKAALHERLREKAAELFRAAGNNFPRLANRARAISDLLDVPFDRLDLLSLHLEIEDLEDRRETGAEEGEPFGDEVKKAILGVTRAGPGLTVGHPDVDLLLDRRRKAREEVVVAAEDAAHRRLLQAVIDDPAANGPHSRAMAALLAEVEDEAASRALQKSKHQNLLWTVTTVAILTVTDVGSNVAANLIAEAFGKNITAFVSTNWTLLSEVAATYGRGVLVWFQQNVGPLVAGIDPTVVRPVKLPKRPK